MSRSKGLLVLVGLFSLASIALAEPIRVMSFNLRYINSEDVEGKAWSSRKDHVAELIQQDSPNILGVQEAQRPMLDDLDSHLAGYVEIGVGRQDGSTAGEYNAILVRTERFSVQESGTFWLSDTPDIAGSRSWGNNVVRICTWVKLWDKKSRAVFHVYNTHFDHQSQPARERSARLLLERIASRQPSGPFMFMGDLNAGPENSIHELFLSTPTHAVDVWKTLHPEVPPSEAGTVHGFKGHKSGGRIDYIYASPDFRLIDAKVLHDSKNGIWPSDHFPVRATIELSSVPATLGH
jgi:endonuclease/exonuclease/phosphatase family metal-dependent hydrolase